MIRLPTNPPKQQIQQIVIQAWLMKESFAFVGSQNPIRVDCRDETNPWEAIIIFMVPEYFLVSYNKQEAEG